MWEETGETRPGTARGRAPRNILSVCGAAFLGNLWGVLGPPGLGWIALLAGALAWCAVASRLGDIARPPTHFLCPLLIAVAAAARVPHAPPLLAGRDPATGRWAPRGTSYGETRGRVGPRTLSFHLPEGAVAAGESIAVLAPGGAVRRARPPAGWSPEPASIRHPEIAWVRADADEVVRLTPARASPLRAWSEAAARVRAAGLRRAAELPSEDARNLCRALLFGDRGAWPASASDLFARTGTRHVLSLSGLHVALLSWLVARPLGSGLAAGLTHLLRTCGAGVRCSPILTQALLVWTFVPIAGAGAPVVRAAWALTLALLARWVPADGTRRGRRPWPLALWAFALLLECVVDPRAPLELSVQLSYAATLGLILGFRGARQLGLAALRRVLPLADTGASGRRRPAWLVVPARCTAEAIVTGIVASVAAVAATLPLVWTRFGEWCPWGLVATPFVLPPLAALMGLASVWMLVPIAPLARAVDLAASSLLALLHGLDALPGTPVQLPPRPLELLVALALLVFAWLRSRRGSRTLALGVALVCLPWTPTARSLEVVACEVGHGTAILLRAPGGACWLFDAGSRDRPSVARDAVAPVLRRWDAARLHVVVSHDHRDHTSGLPWLLGRWPVVLRAGALPAGPGTTGTPDVRGRPAVDLASGRLELPTAGGELGVALLRGHAGPGNEGSRSLEVRWGRRVLLFCGDAEAAGLAAQLRGGTIRAGLDLLLVPHHGAPGRELAGLLDRAEPREAWVSRTASRAVSRAVSRTGDPPCRAALEERGIPWKSTAGGALRRVLPLPGNPGPASGYTRSDLEAPRAGLPRARDLDDPRSGPRPIAPAGALAGDRD